MCQEALAISLSCAICESISKQLLESRLQFIRVNDFKKAAAAAIRANKIAGEQF